MRFFAALNPKQNLPGFKIHPFYQWFIDGYFGDQQESKCRPWWQLQLGSVAQRK
jgi:hypothetical protein